MSIARQQGNRTRRHWRSTFGSKALVLGGVFLAGSLILLPLAAVFYYAFRDGWDAYWGHLLDRATRHSIHLSLLAGGVAVTANTLFGLAAAWTVSKFNFRGRGLLISAIELPLSISPIIIGVAYLFVFGMQGLLGPWLDERGIRLVFNVSSIVIVTTIVTTPFVFKQILPLMQTQGTDAEEAAATLGAGGATIFAKVTLPGIKWALIYGVSLCLSRALGEFGSVAVVSGAVRGKTNTIPLQIELLFNDRVQTGAFAVATILTSISLITLIVKAFVESNELQDDEGNAG